MSEVAAAFAPSEFQPHGYCVAWDPPLVGLHVISDGLTALAYYSIPLALVTYVAKRQESGQSWIYWLFAAFIMACGTTHLMAIYTLWVPAYWAEGAIKAGTAAVSVAAAVALWPLVPRALAVPSPAQLQAVNAQLVAEAEEHRRTAERLRASEQGLAEAQRMARLGHWERNLQTGEVTWAAETYELFGVTPEQHGHSFAAFMELVHPADRERLGHMVQQAEEQGRSFRSDFRIVRPDGTERILDGLWEVVTDDAGRTVRLLGTMQDVTERKRTEERLRESEARLARAQRIAHIGSWTHDLPTGDLTWSAQTYRIFGISPQEFGHTLEAALHYVHPDDRDAYLAAIQRSRDSAQPGQCGFRIRRPDGAERIVDAQWEVECDDQGRAVHAHGTVQDITERKRTEEALEDSRQRLAGVLDMAMDAIISVDEQQRIVLFNRGAETIFGRPAAAALGQHLDVLLPERFREVHRRHVAGFAHSPRANRMMGERSEIFALRGDGTEFPAEASISRLETKNGKIFTAILRDISERKAAEQRIAEKQQALEQSNRALQEFAHVASHDLQEPLRKIQAFGGRLASRYGEALDETGRDYLDRTLGATERMRGLIDDLLAYSRLSTRARAMEPVDLNRVLAAVRDDLEPRLQETGGRVEADALPTVTADEGQMHQLLLNLVSNGLKFRKPDVPPVVRVHCERAGPGAAPGGDTALWRLTVSDNGIGFDPRYGERIFQVFQRLHSRSRYEGTGIGLAICSRIVSRHGGTITAHGTEGQGATFTILLPEQPPGAASGAEPTTEEHGGRQADHHPHGG